MGLRSGFPIRAAQEHGDARKALDLLRISAELAERDDREIVTVDYVTQAQNVMEKDQVRSIISTLPIHYKATLASAILNQGKRENGQQTTGEVYSTYTKICERFNLSDLSQRRIGHIISELDMQGLINAKIVSLGRQGRTKFISVVLDENQVKELFREDNFLSDIMDELTKTTKSQDFSKICCFLVNSLKWRKTKNCAIWINRKLQNLNPKSSQRFVISW